MQELCVRCVHCVGKVIDVILRAVEIDDIAIREYVATTMCNLSFNEGCKGTLVEKNVVKVIIVIVTTTTATATHPNHDAVVSLIDSYIGHINIISSMPRRNLV